MNVKERIENYQKNYNEISKLFDKSKGILLDNKDEYIVLRYIENILQEILELYKKYNLSYKNDKSVPIFLYGKFTFYSLIYIDIIDKIF